MPASPFLDTNVLIYSVVKDDPRSEIAEALLAAGGVATRSDRSPKRTELTSSVLDLT